MSHAKRHKIVLVWSLHKMTTYPTFSSWKLSFGCLQYSQRHPNKKAFLGSGVDFAQTSAISLPLSHLRSQSLALPPYGHGRKKEGVNGFKSFLPENMYVKTLACSTTSQSHRSVASS
jgi:hypothetical protein